MAKASPREGPDRALQVISVIANEPGISVEGLLSVLEAMGKPISPATLRRVITELKRREIISQAPQRMGYFLGGSMFSPEEQRTLINALRMEGINLRNPLARKLHDQLLKRLGKDQDLDVFGYPSVAIANRVVVRTLGEDYAMLMEGLHAAIRDGREVMIHKIRDPWHEGHSHFRVIPLQFIFNDIAWYLLAEDLEARWFKVFRLDRLSPALDLLDAPGRGLRRQAAVLKRAKKILSHGWGMRLPDSPFDPEALDQHTVDVEVVFDASVAAFIEENKRRHPTQRSQKYKDGRRAFRVKLPTCVLGEFSRWVMAWGPKAVVTRPESLASKLREHYEEAVQAYARPLPAAEPAGPEEWEIAEEDS